MESSEEKKTTVLTQTIFGEDKKIICNICNLRFSSKKSFTRHEKRHTVDKIIKCEFCEKSFYRKDCLHIHRRTHFDEKPYSCDICSHAFLTAYRMKRHKKRKHGIVFEEKNSKKTLISERNKKEKIKISENKNKRMKIKSKNVKQQEVENKKKCENERLALELESKREYEDLKTELCSYDVYKTKTRHHKRHDIFNLVSTVIFESYEKDLTIFFKNLKIEFYNELFFQLLDKNQYQWYFVITATLMRSNPEGYSDYLIVHFRTEMVTQLNDEQLLEVIEEMFQKIIKRFDEFNTWTFQNVNFLELNIAKF